MDRLTNVWVRTSMEDIVKNYKVPNEEVVKLLKALAFTPEGLRSVEDYLNIPTISSTIQTGSGYELDALSENFKFKSVREEGESDSSFRIKLLVEYYEGFWEVSLLEDNQ